METWSNFSTSDIFMAFMGLVGLLTALIVVKTAFANAQFRERLAALGADPVGDSPAEFKAVVSADIKRFAEIARLGKIQPE